MSQVSEVRSIKARLMEERLNLEEKRKSLRKRFSIILATVISRCLYLTIVSGWICLKERCCH